MAARKTEGEFDLSDRDRLLKGGDHGPAVVANDPGKSLLYLMVAHEKKPAMPYKEPKLADDVVRQFATWIENGAPYDSPLIARKDTGAWIEKNVSPEGRQHWAYQPLKEVHRRPSSRTQKWVKTDVDRFILSKLGRKRRITPNPQAATKRVLILRRAYFDLIGLPPTPEEVDAFLKDGSPECIGKRRRSSCLTCRDTVSGWARHWLDPGWRLPESHGFEHDYDRPGAYFYRDFVIKAFNQGMPYDKFVRWQVAGDELARTNPLALMATGFLRGRRPFDANHQE